jgi:hypothetical protein
MAETVRKAAADLNKLAVLQCRHFAYGVGTIPMTTILSARDLLVEPGLCGRVGIATVSACHGLVDTLQVDW